MSEKLTTEHVEEILAGCEGATPGPWGEGDKWVFASPRDGNPSSALENILRNEEAQANAAHIARLDPQTVASLATELLALRNRLAAVPTHRHKKHGGEYVLIGIGTIQAERWLVGDTLAHPVDGYTVAGIRAKLGVDMREVAIYRSVDDGSLWVRPREEFEDGRFEALSTPKEPS